MLLKQTQGYNMKYTLFSLMLLMPLSSFAGVISFKCVSNDLPGIHKFDAHGVVSIDDNKKVEGLVSLAVEKAQAEHSGQTFDEVRVTGNLRNFSSGENAPTDYIQLALTTESGYIKSMDLLLDYKEESSSNIVSIDNFSYRSNCFTE
jgi:hypothetical protein